MREGFRLALAFIRVPRLFFALLFWPLVIGFLLAVGQGALSVGYIKTVSTTPEDVDKELSQSEAHQSWLRGVITGDPKPFQSVSICRWKNGNLYKSAEGSDCSIDKDDLVIQTPQPLELSSSEYVDHFKGIVPEIHICEDCSSNFLIRSDKDRFKLSSIKSLGLYILTEEDHISRRKEHFKDYLSDIKDAEQLEGEVVLKLPAFKRGLELRTASQRMVVTANIAGLIILVLWLALKAHKRVLDYFSKNDALLPLVAACGKDTFYLSLWIVTAFRVVFFLLSAVPATILFYVLLGENPAGDLFKFDYVFFIWLACLFLALGAVTVLASIADLKSRASFSSILYRWLPFGLFAMGSLAWVPILLFGSESAYWLSQIIAVIPMLGLAPVIASPILYVEPISLVIHGILSLCLIIYLLRANSEWFASHLEAL